MARRPTLRDVSESAGVSIYTTSRALSGRDGLSAQTRSRVLKIAKDLGYIPNALAAGLKSQASLAIGVITASGRNQYYSMLVQAIDGVLQQSGFHAVTSDAMRSGSYSEALETESVDQLLQQRVAAIVATYSLTEASLDKIHRWGIPVVFVDALPPSYASGAPFIGCDNRGASRKVAEYIATLGMTRATFLAFPKEWNTRAPREAGFTETCAAAGIAVSVVESENTSESALHAMLQHLEASSGELPEVVYASNTIMLHGALRAIRARGLTVPTDISVIGFDDFDWAELLNPAVTVVDQHIGEIGEIAAKTIVDIVGADQDAAARVHIEIEPHLVIRDSCTPAHSLPRVAIGDARNER